MLFFKPDRLELLVLSFFLLSCGLRSRAQQVAIVDDSSSRIIYKTPNGQNWVKGSDPGLAARGLYNGTETWVDIQGSKASLEFNGTTAEFWGGYGPAHGPCRIDIDGIDHGIVNTYGQAYGPGVLLFQYIGLSTNQSHTISVTVEAPFFPNVCSIDRFQYAMAVLTVPSSTPNTSSTDNTVIIGAAVGGSVGFIIAFFAVYFGLRRCRKRPQPHDPNMTYSNAPTNPHWPVSTLAASSHVQSTGQPVQFGPTPSQDYQSMVYSMTEPRYPHPAPSLGTPSQTESSLSGLRSKRDETELRRIASEQNQLAYLRRDVDPNAYLRQPASQLQPPMSPPPSYIPHSDR